MLAESTASQILTDIMNTLVDSELFRQVNLGESDSANLAPRVSLIYDGLESFAPDDTCEGSWQRLRATLRIHVRSTDTVEGIRRISQLARQAGKKILVDRYRNGHCCDLPIGKATEIGRFQLNAGVRRPSLEMTCDLRCHFETREES